MQVQVNYEGGLQFQAIARNHVIWGDQPRDGGGSDKGMTPIEWFLAALGSCVGCDVVKYCQAREVDATGLSIQINAKKVSHPARLDEIEIHVTLPIALNEDHYEGLEDTVNACLLRNTLIHAPQITTQITAGFIAPSTL
jgi:putative redox protein